MVYKMNQYGYAQYKEQSVNTMTKGEMLILLYDEMIKRLTRAELALEKGDFALFDASIQRTNEIVTYLSTTLDRTYSISNEISRLYDFFKYELTRLAAGRRPEIIRDLKPLIIEMRDTFKEADRLSKN